MIEKVRMTVDQETEEILERIKDDIEDRLAEKPFWADEISREFARALKNINEKNDELVTNEFKNINVAIEESKELSNTLHAQLLKQGEGNVELVTNEFKNINVAIEESKEFSKSLSALFFDQQSILQDCHKKLEYMLMPWWKRLFRRKP